MLGWWVFVIFEGRVHSEGGISVKVAKVAYWRRWHNLRGGHSRLAAVSRLLAVQGRVATRGAALRAGTGIGPEFEPLREPAMCCVVGALARLQRVI